MDNCRIKSGQGHKGNKKSFYRYVGDKRKIWEYMGSFQKETAYLVTQDIGNTEVLSKFFALVFTSRCSSLTTRVTEGKDRDWENEELPTADHEV